MCVCGVCVGVLCVCVLGMCWPTVCRETLEDHSLALAVFISTVESKAFWSTHHMARGMTRKKLHEV